MHKKSRPYVLFWQSVLWCQRGKTTFEIFEQLWDPSICRSFSLLGLFTYFSYKYIPTYVVVIKLQVLGTYLRIILRENVKLFWFSSIFCRFDQQIILCCGFSFKNVLQTLNTISYGVEIHKVYVLHFWNKTLWNSFYKSCTYLKLATIDK